MQLAIIGSHPLVSGSLDDEFYFHQQLLIKSLSKHTVLLQPSSIFEQEIPDHLNVPCCLLQLRDMCRVGKLNPFDLGNVFEEWLDRYVLRFVVTPIQNQRGDVYLVKIIDDAPSFERTNNVELVWSVPSQVSKVRA